VSPALLSHATWESIWEVLGLAGIAFGATVIVIVVVAFLKSAKEDIFG
jgi:hypothetical protein